MNDPIKTKICSKCPEKGPQPLTNFTKRRDQKDGHATQCKACQSKYMAAYYEMHTAALCQKSRDYRATHVEELAAYHVEYHQKHAEKKNAIATQWYADNIERGQATRRAYNKANPEKIREGGDRRRARIKNAPFREHVSLDVLYKRDKGICNFCKKKVARKDASRDHIVPVSQGGEHSYRNCVLMHKHCNSKKRTRRIPQQMGLL